MRKFSHTKSFAGSLAIFLLFSFTVPHLQFFSAPRTSLSQVIGKKTQATKSDSQFPFEEQENEKEDLEDDSADQRDNRVQQTFFFAGISYLSVVRLQAESTIFGKGQARLLHGNAVHVPLYLAKCTLLI
jgi:hypothetical protein